MKGDRKPERMCCACREHDAKGKMLRIVKNPEGKIEIDFSSKAPGRGAYICKKYECAAAAEKKNAISRALGANASGIYKEIYEWIDRE